MDRCRGARQDRMSARVSNSRHRRQRLHRLGAGEGAGQGRRAGARARRQLARPPAPAAPTSRKTSNSSRGDIRDAAHGREAPRRAWTRCITSPSSTAPSSSTAQPDLVLDVGVQGHDQRARRLPQARRRHARAGVELRGLPDAAARSRPTRARRCRCRTRSTRAIRMAAARSSAS